MTFMDAEVYQGTWWEITNEYDETVIIPGDVPDPMTEDDLEMKEVTGWGAHLTAHGYLDQTDWTVFETEQEAWDHIHESYCDQNGDGGESYCNLPSWEVIVGNIGSVYRGCDETYSRETFATYKQQSIDDYGRGGSEQVHLMEDDEMDSSYIPGFDSEVEE